MQTIRLTDEEVIEVLKCITYCEIDAQEAMKKTTSEVTRDYWFRQVEKYSKLWDYVFSSVDF